MFLESDIIGKSNLKTSLTRDWANCSVKNDHT